VHGCATLGSRVPTLRTSTQLKLAYVALATTDTWLSGQPNRWAHRARFLTKPLLMPALAGSLATNARAAGSPLRTSTLLAQVGGWGGDVALLGEGTRPFLLGAGSFGLGHAAYLSGFVRHRGTSPITANPGARAVAGSWAATAPVMGLLAWQRQRELGGPVFGYATMLAAVVASATHLDPGLSPASRRLTAAGAGLFMLSDTLLGVRKFALRNPPAQLETAVMATYTAAQFLLSEGAARA
jgi:uncharacterized membrane protein YhhN